MNKKLNEMTREDYLTIAKIANRSVLLNHKLDKLSVEMDFWTCMTNGNQIKLEELLKADNFNFMHDVVGIWNNLNRTTLELENCFCPRFLA